MNKYFAYLIDDDKPTGIYNEIMIEDSGLFDSWKIFSSAQSALEALKTEAEIPDIIFLDINMPIHTGWDFLDMYEASDIEQKCPCIIMLSTSMSKFDLSKSEKYLRVKDFKVKPLTQETIKESVELV